MKSLVHEGAHDVPVVFGSAPHRVKGWTTGTGQGGIETRGRLLRALIGQGGADRSWTVPRGWPLMEAPGGYRHSDVRGDGWTRVPPHPAAGAVAGAR